MYTLRPDSQAVALAQLRMAIQVETRHLPGFRDILVLFNPADRSGCVITTWSSLDEAAYTFNDPTYAITPHLTGHTFSGVFEVLDDVPRVTRPLRDPGHDESLRGS